MSYERRPVTVTCDGCGWWVQLLQTAPGQLAVDAVDGWEVTAGRTLCDRCVSGWRPTPPEPPTDYEVEVVNAITGSVLYRGPEPVPASVFLPGTVYRFRVIDLHGMNSEWGATTTVATLPEAEVDDSFTDAVAEAWHFGNVD